MPIHDWTRVGAGTWHDFHLAWIAEIRLALNDGRLPEGYYAQAEQIVGSMGPDVLTLQSRDWPQEEEEARELDGPAQGGLALTLSPPKARLAAEGEIDIYARKRSTVVIRHSSGDRIIALIELISPGNKTSQSALQSFVGKAVAALRHGYHLLIVDLFPPTPRDPLGLPSAIWEELMGVSLPPLESPLSLSAFTGGWMARVFLEATAVGRPLLEMPLFLDPETYINVPLEETYLAAYRGVPQRWKRVLEDR